MPKILDKVPKHEEKNRWTEYLKMGFPAFLVAIWLILVEIYVFPGVENSRRDSFEYPPSLFVELSFPYIIFRNIIITRIIKNDPISSDWSCRIDGSVPSILDEFLDKFLIPFSYIVFYLGVSFGLFSLTIVFIEPYLEPFYSLLNPSDSWKLNYEYSILSYFIIALGYTLSFIVFAEWDRVWPRR